MTFNEFIKRILLKVTSSKFWAYLSVFVVSVLAIFNVDSGTQTKVTAMIIAFGNVVVYLFANVWQKKVLGQNTDENQ